MTLDCIERSSIGPRTILLSSTLAATSYTLWALYTEDTTPQDGPEPVTSLREDWNLCLTREGVGTRVQEGEGSLRYLQSYLWEDSFLLWPQKAELRCWGQ